MKTNLSFRNGEFGQKRVMDTALFGLVDIRKSKGNDRLFGITL